MLNLNSESVAALSKLATLVCLTVFILPVIYLYIERDFFFLYILILLSVFWIYGIPNISIVRPLYSEGLLVFSTILFSLSMLLTEVVSQSSLLLFLMYLTLVFLGVDFSSLMGRVLQAFFVFILCGFVFSLFSGSESVCSSNGLRLGFDFLGLCDQRRYSGFFYYPIDHTFLSLIAILYFYQTGGNKFGMIMLLSVVFYLSLLSESRTMLLSFFAALYFKNQASFRLIAYLIVIAVLFFVALLDMEFIMTLSDRFNIWRSLWHEEGVYNHLLAHNFLLYLLYAHDLWAMRAFTLLLFALFLYVLYIKQKHESGFLLLFFVFFTGTLEVYLRLDMLSLGSLLFFGFLYSDRVTFAND